ncbi:preprotein translocase subunit SecY [Buchnera aphidicola (Ceratoglyphina bambusae)]|uniref:preprotein translocase subunit SecY n=1 Tax=Buchnera aphidicola TaxID=9 RepID=UPI0031B849BC
MIKNLNSKIDEYSDKNFCRNENELKNRILFVIFAIIIFRIGSLIPIPGIDISVLSKILSKNHGNFLDMLNMFSGGAIYKASIFSLGIMPYISSSIVIQLLTFITPFFSDMKKDGENGKKQINKYTKYLTLLLAIIQSIGISVSLPNIPIFDNLVINNSFKFYVLCSLSLMTGTMFLMWMGDLITKYGIGNGVSIIIFLGIISTVPLNFLNFLEKVRLINFNWLVFIFLFLFIFFIFFFIAFIERSYYKIPIQYANRTHIRKIYISGNSYLPLKVNIVGVIPAIFASSIILLFSTVISWISNLYKNNFLLNLSVYLKPNNFFYILIYSFFIIFFCFFYTKLIFNPIDTSENLKKSSAFIKGIRPGNNTSIYINRVVSKLTFIGSLYITFICTIPDFIRYLLNYSFYFSGTSLLIVVVVVIDCINQIQNIIVSKSYVTKLNKKNKYI